MERHILFVFGSQGCVVPLGPLRAAKDLGCRTTIIAPSAPCDIPDGLMDRFAQVSLSRVDQVLEAARSLHNARPLHAVVGYDDQSAPLVARIAAELGLPGHPVAAADAARDKALMKEHFTAAGVPIAPYTLAADEDAAVQWAGETGYPVVVKPVRGAASQGVIRADNEAALRAAYRRLSGIVRDFGLDTGGRSYTEQLVEAYLDGSEISVELLLQDGTPHVLCVFEKPQPLHGPFFEETIYVTPARLPAEQRREAEALAARAAAAIGLRQGLAHCEIRVTSGGPFVLEIAARVIGGACSQVVSHALGQDIHATIIRLALGDSFAIPAQGEVAAGAMMLPIPREGRLVAVRGVDLAQQTPGIQDIDIRVSAGDVILPFPEQSSYVGLLTATGETPEAVINSLTQAAGHIDFELQPILCEYWTRDLGDGLADEPLAQPGIESLEALHPDEAREIVIPIMAASYFGELPAAEARARAEACVRDLQEGNRGETATTLWLVAEDRGVVLGSLTGNTGYISCIGVTPGRQQSGLGEALGRAIIQRFARQGCTTVGVHVDPRQPAAVSLYRRLGMAPDMNGTDSCCTCS